MTACAPDEHLRPQCDSGARQGGALAAIRVSRRRSPHPACAFIALTTLALAGCDDPPPSSSADDRPAPRGSVAPALDLRPVDPPAEPGAVALSPASSGEAVIGTWIEPVSDEVHRVRFATLRGSPPRWSAATTVVESERVLASSVDFPIPARAADGTYFATLLMRGRERHASHVHLARSPDGVAWRDLGPVHQDDTETEHGHASLFRDGHSLRALWLDGRAWVEGGPMAIRTAVVGSDGELAQREVLDPRVCDCCQTAGVTTEAGPFVAYRDRSVTEVRDVSTVRRSAGRWSPPATVHDDGWRIQGCPVNGPQADARGRAVAVTWYTEGEPGPRVRVAFSDDAGATFGGPVDVDTAAPVGRVDVIWIDDASVLVAWLGVPEAGGAIGVRLRRVSRGRRVGAIVDAVNLGGERAVGVPRLSRFGQRMLLAWGEAGPPRRVRAALFDPTSVAAPTSVAPPAPAAVLAAGLALGTPLPDVEVARVEGGMLDLGELRGTPTVVSFFATWCEPCRGEFPLLARLASEHGEGLRVVGVSIDEAPPATVAAFAREHGLRYLVAHDTGGDVAGAFGVPPIPATFVFDAAGELAFAHRGGGAELLEALPRAVAAALRSASEQDGDQHGHREHGH